jgi:Domain of unknown function (DUF5668)
MRPDGRLLGLGLFLITLGAVLLGIRQGWIPTDVAARAWQLWPLLLVAGGLSILLAGRPGAPLGGLIVAACLGAMLGGLIGTGSGIPFVGCGAADDGSNFLAQSGELPGTARVRLTFQCGELSVATGDGSTWVVDGRSGDGSPPRIDASADRLAVEAAHDGLFDAARSRESWTVTLPTDPTIELDLTLNAGSGDLDLDGAHLASVGLTVNAGSLDLDLRDAASADELDGTINAGSAVVRLPELPVNGSLTINAGSLVLCAPEGVGLRFVTEGGIASSNDFDDQGLIEADDDTWETSDFATAPIRITLDVQANAGSLSLNPTRDCAG